VDFPALKARVALRLLQREPLCYRETRRHGSHRKLESDYPGAQPIGFAYHQGKTVPPRVLRHWLIDLAGLSETEAKELLG
jgi:predicted RNA binding protein YcfA (HicA-like mRNA interferase family)